MILYIGFFLMSHDVSSDHESSSFLKNTVVVAPPVSPNELIKKNSLKVTTNNCRKMASNGIFGGIVGDGFVNKDDRKSKLETRFTATLDHVFETFDTPRIIDYLSLDVEGVEEFLIEDFPFDSYKFLTMTVERLNKALQKILNDHGYKFVKTLTYWGETVWVHSDHAKENNIKVSSEPPKWDEARVVHGD